MPSDLTPLMSTPPSSYQSVESNGPFKNLPPPPSDKILTPLLLSTFSFGMRSFCTAINVVGTGLIMSNLGPQAIAALSAAGTLQNLVIAGTLGFLSGVGADLGHAIGKERTLNPLILNPMIRVAWFASVVLGTFALAIFLAAARIFQSSDEASAKATADYLMAFAITTIPETLLWANGQIIYQIEQNTWFPTLTTAFYKLGALALSYYFSLSLGPFGVGLGSGIMSVITLIIVQSWMFKKVYRDLNLYEFFSHDFKTYLLQYLKSSWKFSLQRITEWLNLFIITQIIGAWSEDTLTAEQPSLIALNISGFLSQGFAIGAMQIASRDSAAFKSRVETDKSPKDLALLNAAKSLLKRHYQILFIGVIISTIANAGLATGIYFLRNILIHAYVGDGVYNKLESLTNTLLIINLLSIVPDSLRIVTGGILRGWKEILIPAIVNLLIMSGGAILVGALVGLSDDRNSLPLFYARIGGIVLSFLFNSIKITTYLQKQNQLYNVAQLKMPCNPTAVAVACTVN